ncbi:DNA adenine methylase [Streptobacillus canis]|uniref:DNA adenine methylase n=1 Tax=Streptobacillus canis TaxID=2678686 RepID=UPI0012E1BA47|nr:DNA adenine methylase [Streptobacillus canis]
MKYIGNKTKIIDFIEKSLIDSDVKYKNKRVMDLFSGTGSVSKFFLRNNCEVISCDNMTYSVAEQYRVNYFRDIPNFEELELYVGGSRIEEVLYFLNNLEPQKGYFYENYAPNGIFKRQYFTNENAMKIDAIRSEIETWKDVLSYEKYMYLLGILMNASDRVSNTSGTYGAYLKIWRSMALKELRLEVPENIKNGKNIINLDDVLDCVDKYKNLDIIYLDPPYNTRQYASNFHVLENIVVFDKQKLNGKTGLRNYKEQKSDFSLKTKVEKALKKLLIKSSTKVIVMSYSTEGLIKEEKLYNLLSEFGETKVYRKDYRRFKTNAWTSKETNLQELLFVTKIRNIEVD